MKTWCSVQIVNETLGTRVFFIVIFPSKDVIVIKVCFYISDICKLVSELWESCAGGK